MFPIFCFIQIIPPKVGIVARHTASIGKNGRSYPLNRAFHHANLGICYKLNINLVESTQK